MKNNKNRGNLRNTECQQNQIFIFFVVIIPSGNIVDTNTINIF